MLLASLLSVIAPHDCLCCGAEGALVCASCSAKIPVAHERCYRCHSVSTGGRTCGTCRSSSDLYAVHTLTAYEGLAKDLVWKLKFGRARAAGKEIGRLLPSPVVTGTTVVTHAPTAAMRVRQRGYDQAALIAKAFARQAGLSYTPLLSRLTSLKQVGASRHVRKRQLDGAFRPLHVGRIKGAHIILIDDVITTGATLEAAARVLKKAGARRVEAVVFARA